MKLSFPEEIQRLERRNDHCHTFAIPSHTHHNCHGLFDSETLQDPDLIPESEGFDQAKL
jgi:hypothetical protein